MADLAVRNVLAVLNGRSRADAGHECNAAHECLNRIRIAFVPKRPVATVMRRLAKAIDGLEEPAVEKIAKKQQENPFQVLIATMLSAQTKDAVTHAASTRLFRVARTPRTMAKLHDPRRSSS